MNKADLISAVAAEAGLSKVDAIQPETSRTLDKPRLTTAKDLQPGQMEVLLVKLKVCQRVFDPDINTCLETVQIWTSGADGANAL